MGTRRDKNLLVRQYLRVSKDRSGKGVSPDQQAAENAAAVAAEGWTLHSDPPYRDSNRSASRYAKREREDFARLVADLTDGTFGADVLILWESSRGSRRLGEWATLIDLCADEGVRIYVTTHHRLYDPRNARDRRSLGEDAVDAEYESNKTSERIKRNVRAAAAEGRVHGKNLYGYQRHYVQGISKPVLDSITEHPEQGPVVRDIFRRAEAGESFYSIAKRLNEQGVAPRRPPRSDSRKHLGWTAVAVKQLLTVPAYAGKRVHQGEVVSDAQWPALIPYDRWVALQPKISPEHRKRTAGDWTAKHLLSGIARCSVCGSGLRVGKQNRKLAGGERERYNTYVCSGAESADGRGFHVAMKQDTLDRFATEVVLGRLERPDFLAAMGSADDRSDDERQALLDEIAGHRAYLDTVRDQAAELQRFDLVLDQEARIQPKIDAAQARLEQLAGADPAVLALAASGAVREAWQGMDVAARRRVIRALVQPAVRPLGRGAWRGPESDVARVEWRWR